MDTRTVSVDGSVLRAPAGRFIPMMRLCREENGEDGGQHWAPGEPVAVGQDAGSTDGVFHVLMYASDVFEKPAGSSPDLKPGSWRLGWDMKLSCRKAERCGRTYAVVSFSSENAG